MRSVLIICICAFVATGLAWFGASQSPTTPAPERVDFSWQAMDGSTHTLSEFAGRPVVLHFWASWCAPCLEEFPKLLMAAKESKENVIFLTISSDENLAKAQHFLSKMKIAPANVLYGFDPAKTITYDLFQTVQYPETILLDKDHRLRHKFPGAVDWSGKEARNLLKALSTPENSPAHLQ